MWGGLFESLSVIFLLEETAYYSISDKIKEEKQTLNGPLLYSWRIRSTNFYFRL